MTCQSNFVTRMSTIEKGEYFSVANSWCNSDTAHIIGDKKSSFFPMRTHQWASQRGGIGYRRALYKQYCISKMTDIKMSC